MMCTWNNPLTLNNVKTVLQVLKKTHKAQLARYKRYHVTCSADYFQHFFQKRIGYHELRKNNTDLHSLSGDLGACDFRKDAARVLYWRQRF